MCINFSLYTKRTNLKNIMKIKTILLTIAKIYQLLEKFNLEDRLQLDYILDNNYPEFVSRLQNLSDTAKIALCATNGKKTTTNILNQILENNSKTYFSNVTKEAYTYPILTSIILELAKNKDFDIENDKKNYYTMAMDEFELAGYFNSMRFDYLLLSNLFIDQKDFSCLEDKKKKIQNAIMLNSKLNLIINADEPMFFQIDEIKNDALLTKKRNKFYYGFNDIEFVGSTDSVIQKNDLMKCPNCGCSLDYRKRFYSHIGQYDCECGFKRPKLNLSANAKIFNDYSLLEVFYEDNKMVFKVPLGGIYNAYNALGAIAVAICLNINRKTIFESFEKLEPLRARDEILTYKNKKIKIKTIKNPTSLSESIRELHGAKNIKVVFCLADTILDGVDTSWIWDSNFEALRGFENKIYITSSRFDDMALRLKYAQVNPCLMVMDSNIKSAIDCCYYELEKNETMLILTTPSEIDKIYDIVG